MISCSESSTRRIHVYIIKWWVIVLFLILWNSERLWIVVRRNDRRLVCRFLRAGLPPAVWGGATGPTGRSTSKPVDRMRVDGGVTRPPHSHLLGFTRLRCSCWRWSRLCVRSAASSIRREQSTFLDCSAYTRVNLVAPPPLGAITGHCGKLCSAVAPSLTHPHPTLQPFF